MSRPSSLWTTVDTLLDGRTEAILRENVAAGATWDQIAHTFADLGAPVSREWLRQQAHRLGIERAA